MPSRAKMGFLTQCLAVWMVAAALLPPSRAELIFNVTHSAHDEPDFATVQEGALLPLNITLLGGLEEGVVTVASQDSSVFDVVDDDAEVTVAGAGDLPLTFTVHVRGKFVGISALELLVDDAPAAGPAEPETAGEYTVKVVRVPTILDFLFSYLLLVWLVLSYITTGAKMQPKIIWSKMKPPWSILVGMLGQFIIMPAWAFALTKIFSLDDETALGLIFVGTCPGGWLSNIFSLLLDCDFVLSLTMTFCSTVIAMGMMPLNLFIYATPIVADNAELRTPFGELALQLGLLIIPIGLGMALCYKFEKFKKICEKLLKPLAGILILLALGLGIPSQLFIFSSPWQVWVVSALLPIGGVALGAALAKLICRPKKAAITIALETGAQNALLAKTMLDLFYPRPEADLVGRVPLMTSLISLVEGSVVIVIYVLTHYVFCRKEEDQEELVDDKKETKDLEAVEKAPEKDPEADAQATEKMEEAGVDQTHVNPVFDATE